MKLKLPLHTITQKVPRALQWVGEHAFFSFLILLLGAAALSLFVFYRYVFLLQEVEVQPVVQIRFEQERFEQVVQTWEARSNKFETAGQQPLRDVFTPPALEQEN